MINHKISKCKKLAQKEFGIWQDWVRKVIHWELCKKFKSVQENETHKLPWDFEIQTDHLISARRPDLVIVNKKKRTNRIVDFAVPELKIKENEKRDKYHEFARELKNMEHEGDGDTHCTWLTWKNPQRISKRIGKLGNKRTSGNHPDYSIKIGKNTEKSRGDFKRLAVIQTPVKNHLQTLVGKTLGRV